MSEKEGTSGNADGDSESLNLPQDGNSFSCSRVAVRVPAFWANNVKLYFAQIEANFRIAGIVSEQTKFDTLVAVLDPQTLTMSATYCIPHLKITRIPSLKTDFYQNLRFRKTRLEHYLKTWIWEIESRPHCCVKCKS
ncbi:hypothetical protein AVEN_70755-1 [Araneus ventricosus]|uniref:DUF7041 domain-containing protein n=1 Tax=Araneus ventricosus TaxID=182803 RepID=A0A4Y2N0E0_ARAVE|nr:hypothetical protein AVEN_70755-1 [Araneus ventricosus]